MMYLTIHEDADLVRDQFTDILDLENHLRLHRLHPRTFTEEERHNYLRAVNQAKFGQSYPYTDLVFNKVYEVSFMKRLYYSLRRILVELLAAIRRIRL